jgi:hypothetical protein
MTASVPCDQPRTSPQGACAIAEREFRTPLAQRGIFGEPQRRRLLTRCGFAIRSVIDMREAAGAAKSATLMDRARSSVRRFSAADSAPWCGLLAAPCLTEDMPDRRSRCAQRSRRAGACTLHPPSSRPPPFSAPIAGGHVGFYVGEGKTSYHALGGNQADQVSIMWLETSHCAARGLPLGRALIGKPVMMKAIAGIQLPGSEA